MAFKIPAGFAQIGIRIGSPSSHVSEITWGALLDSTPEALSTAIATLIYALPDLIQDCTPEYYAKEVVFTFEPTEGVFESVTGILDADIVGAASGTPMTANVAYLYRKNTYVPGRGKTGRFYLPGVSETMVDGMGVVISTFLGPQADHAASFLDKLASGDPDTPDSELPMFLFHKGNAISVVQLIPENHVATQRRRLVRT